MYPILNGYEYIAVEIKKIQVIHTSFLNLKIKEKQITNKFVMCQHVINLRKFLKIPPSTSMHFGARLWISHIVCLTWSRFFMPASASLGRVSCEHMKSKRQ
jgi:hypothetical protein